MRNSPLKIPSQFCFIQYFYVRPDIQGRNMRSYVHSFPVAAKHYAMMFMTPPPATFACLSFNLHQASASTLAILLWFFFWSPALSLSLSLWLWAPLQFTGRADGQQTNAGRSPPSADRKQSGRAEQRGCCRTFFARTLRNAHAPHLSSSTGFQER